MLMETLKNQISFVEPQSLNFDQKLSKSYLIFQENQDKKNEIKKNKEL
jgi:hypothetical protein